MGAILTWMSRLLARSGGGGGGLELVLTGGEPRVRAPLAASANLLHVAAAGQQPHPLAAWEDSRMLVQGAAGQQSGKGTGMWRAGGHRCMLVFHGWLTF